MYRDGFTQGEQDAADGVYNPPVPPKSDDPLTNEADLQTFKGYKDGHAANKKARNDDTPINYSTFLNGK